MLVRVFIIYLHANFNTFNDSLVVVVTQKITYTFHSVSPCGGGEE
jgi:hypothetical protein